MTSPISARSALEQFIAAQLGEDVLPAPIDIRFFATDFEVTGLFGTGEDVEVGDIMVLTEIP